MKNVTIRDNYAGAYGGGVYNLEKAAPTLNLQGKVEIKNNKADIANNNLNLSEYVTLNILDNMKEQNCGIFIQRTTSS